MERWLLVQAPLLHFQVQEFRAAVRSSLAAAGVRLRGLSRAIAPI
jgi:hypothetical protein